MRCAIIGDIHANLAAFLAVLEDMQRQREVERIWCLGDVVGYGPDPHECIELLRQTDHLCVAGNHDWASTGKISTAEFNPDAAAACQWTAKHLSAADVVYLDKLPQVIVEDDFTLVHGSPREPIWEYVISASTARENFAFFNSKYCLVGHSHVPLVFGQNENGDFTAGRLQANIGLALGRDRMIINPGSVGQPRDGDPHASYAIYDTESRQVRLYRVDYDISLTQDRMVERGLPMRLVARLSYGM